MSGRWERLWGFGDWWIARRPGSRNLYRCGYERGSRQVRRISLSTADLQQAQKALVDWVNACGEMQNTDPRNVTVARCLARYWHRHAQHLPSAEQSAIASRQLLELLGDATVAELTPLRQEELIKALFVTGKGGSTVSRVLSVLRAALRHCWQFQELQYAPFIRDVEKSPPRDRVASVEEMAAFWDACDTPYLRMFFVLAVGTAARKSAVLALTREQCDVRRGVISLLPPGARQDRRKRKPTVAMAPTLIPWIESVESGPLVFMPPLKNDDTETVRELNDVKSAWRRARAAAGLPDDFTPNVLRHTVGTVLREQDAPEGEVTGFMGHKWSNSTTEVYAKYRPGYLKAAAAVTDWLLSEIGRVATRPISSPEAAGVTNAYQSALATGGKPVNSLVGATGIEPVTPTMSTHRKPNEFNG